MIVKRLGMVSGGGFPGAGYNERKVAEGMAQLMVMENVDAVLRHKVELLHEAGFDCSGEIERYLKEKSQTYGNTKTTRFQFHIAASVKGQVMSAEELTDFAKKLMTEAGYGKQPYFVYFHHDTDNNHVHILSTRIQPNGFPISDHQDFRKLNAAANRILLHDIKDDIERMLSYDFATEGQFANILRSHGYTFEKLSDGYRLFKSGGEAGKISNDELLRHITENSNLRQERSKQLRSIIRKYKDEIAAGKVQNVKKFRVHKGQKHKAISCDIRKIKGVDGKLLSLEEQQRIADLLNILKVKFGVDIYFQKDRNGEIRGYGIVDHGKKIAFDGSKVMKLSELIDFSVKQKVEEADPYSIYQDLFTMEINNDVLTIQMQDGTIHCRAMSPRQAAWYSNVPDEDKNDVALRIAVTMFSTEIFESVLRKRPINEIQSRIKDVASIKLKNGGRAIRVISTDGFSAIYPMTADESRCYIQLKEDAANGYLRQLAVFRLTNEDATELTKRIREQTTKSTGNSVFSFRSSVHTPKIVQKFTAHHADTVRRLLSAQPGHSSNREWEVGKHNRYEDIDNRQSDTQLTM